MFTKSKISQSMIDAVKSVVSEEKKRLLNDAELDETGFHKAAHAAKKANQSHFEFQGKKYPVTAKSHAEAIEMDESSEKVKTSTGMKVYGSSYGNSKKARADQTKKEIDKLKSPTEKNIHHKDDVIYHHAVKEEGDCVTEPEAKNIAKKKEQGVAEMDKSQTPPGRAGDYPLGVKGTTRKPVTAKKVVKDLTKDLDRAFAKEKGVKGHEKKMHEEKSFQQKLIERAKLKMKESKGNQPQETFTDNNIGEGHVEVQHKSPSKGTDIADKSYLKDMGKKPTIKGDLKNLGRFLTGKKETNEESVLESKEVTQSHDADKITTDMIKGREDGGKSNAFKSYKLQLKTSGEMKAPEMEQPEDTKARKSIKAKEPHVDLKNLKVEESVLDEMINEVLSKDATAGDYIDDFVHSDNPKFAGKSKKKRKEMALAAYYSKKNEEVELEETVSEGKMKSSVIDKDEDERMEKQGTWKKETPWMPSKNTVTDKSGAKHTPMSRAKDLARSAFKKLQKETMMGKISN
jgi:hypothetical protein